MADAPAELSVNPIRAPRILARPPVAVAEPPELPVVELVALDVAAVLPPLPLKKAALRRFLQQVAAVVAA